MEPRSTVRLLDAAAPRSSGLVTVCSMCKKIQVSPGEWAEVEDALASLALFEADAMPQLTHGLCRPCYQIAMGQLDALETPAKSVEKDRQ